LIKIAVLNLRKTMGIRFQLRFDFITQRRERGARARVGDDALLSVAPPALDRQQQLVDSTLSFGRRKMVSSAHGAVRDF
jgi:hypothetical protein